jgi:hypothetical protein
MVLLVHDPAAEAEVDWGESMVILRGPTLATPAGPVRLRW